MRQLLEQRQLLQEVIDRLLAVNECLPLSQRLNSSVFQHAAYLCSE